MIDKIVTVDVRNDIRSGREPFSRIMSAVADLTNEQELLLVAPFEPKPLFGVLAKKGLQHNSREVGPGHWEVLFCRNANIEAPAQNAPNMSPPPKTRYGTSSASIIDVDARGLEPPQPMIKILETIAVLPYGAQLRAHTDRRPIHLYSQLEERGFRGESEEQNDGSFITHIRRNG